MSLKPVTKTSRMRRLRIACLSGFVVASGLISFPASAQASSHPISFPVAQDEIHKTRWSDTWGAARSGGRSHIGVDILGPKMVPLVAVRDATITWGRYDNNRGSIVRMRDSDGWEYQYIHLNNDTPGTDNGRATCQQAFSARLCSTISNGKLKPGVTVKEGEVIGYLGDSGNAERTAPHLHFETYRPNGQPTNPAPIVNNAYTTLRARNTSKKKAPAPVERIPATKPVAHWPNASVAVDDLFKTVHGRKPTNTEANAFIKSAESRGVWATIAASYSESSGGAELARTYAALFNRNPDIGGYRSWMETRATGKNTRQIVKDFTHSPEFKNIFSNKTNEQYVEALYLNALGRSSDSGGKSRWLNRLNAAELNRADIAYEFVRAQESKKRHRSTVEFTTLSILRSNKTASDSELSSWASLRAQQDLTQVVSSWDDE